METTDHWANDSDDSQVSGYHMSPKNTGLYGEGNEHFQNPVSVILHSSLRVYQVISTGSVQFDFYNLSIYGIWTQCRFVIA